MSAREGRALARSWGVPFLECSAKHNENVGMAFLAAATPVSAATVLTLMHMRCRAGEAFSKLLMAIQKDEGEAPVSEPTCCGKPYPCCASQPLP